MYDIIVLSFRGGVTLSLKKMKPLDYVLILIKGMLLGITSVGIPGLSASTLSIVLGIYFLMINSIADIFKDFKKNIKFVAPLLIGFLLGVGLAAYTIVILFEHFPLITTFAIIGFIISSLPSMIMKLKVYFRQPSCILTFIVILAILTAYNVIRPQNTGMVFPEKVTFVYLFGMAVIGMFAAATFIIPGIDFAIIMLSIGIYYPFMNMIKSFIDFNSPNYLDTAANNGMILTAFLIGLLVGLALFSKLIKFISKKYTAQTQFASLAFVVAAPTVLVRTCIIEPGVVVDPIQLTFLIIIAITTSLLFFSIRTITYNKNRAIIIQADILFAETSQEFVTTIKLNQKRIKKDD